jgi:phosphonate transport system substrate-binding protein
MSLQRLVSPMDRPDGRSVGFVIGGSDLNIATWVSRGMVDAGAMAQSDFDNPMLTPAALRRSLKILDTSAGYPLAMEVARPDLDARVRARLREVLLAASLDPDAREAMLQFSGTNRFIAIDPATQAELSWVRAGIARVRAEVE